MIELLIALVLIDCGLLALVGTSAAVIRQTRVAATRTAAVALAQNRLEWLQAHACGSSSGTTQPRPGLQETWTTNAHGSMRASIAEVRYDENGTSGRIILRARAPC